MIKTGIIGATGYAGEELTRLLAAHPNAEIAHVCSNSFAGRAMSDVYASYESAALPVLEKLDMDRLSDCDFVFTALPHGTSSQVVPQLLERGVRVIDLSGDFRYDDVTVYNEWYGLEHPCPELLAEAVYGLPELYRARIAGARVIGNPGCYTTTSILPLYPLLKAGLVEKDGIVIDAKSGVTGAGRKEKLAYSFCETAENLKAYSVATHRHTSEIEQELSNAAGAPVTLLFTPHLLPVRRGIFATIYARLAAGASAEDIAAAYGVYADEPFVGVLPQGALPELKHVVGSNNCRIGFEADPRTNTLIVVSCTDNLIKGAAGQAVQNMNIMAGLPETTGLATVAWYL